MDAEAETVLLEDGFGDGEAEAGPLFARVGAGAVVAVEDIGQVLGGDAGAVVFHLHPDALGAAQRPQHEDAVFADVVHGVAQKVMQSALHHVGVGTDGKLFVGDLQLELPAVLGADGVVTLADFVAELAHVEVDLLALECAARDLAQLHDAGNKGRQAVGLVHDDVHLFVAVLLVVAGQIAHRLGIALDEGERSAQVVGDVGQQVALHLGGVLDFFCHVVELLGQVAQLVVPHRVHMDGVVALCHLPRSPGESPQRLCEPLAEQPCRRHREGENEGRSQRQNGAEYLAGLGHMHQAGSHQHSVISVGGHPAHHQLDRAGGRGRVDLPHHCSAALPAELPHGAGRGVGGLLVGSVGGAGAV